MPGYSSPDAAHFLAVGFRCAAGARDGVLLSSGFSRRALAPIFSITFFDGWKQTERRGRRVKPARSPARRLSGRSVAQRLDAAPALGTLPAEKMGSPLLMKPGRAGIWADTLVRRSLVFSWVTAEIPKFLGSYLAGMECRKYSRRASAAASHFPAPTLIFQHVNAQ